MRGEPSFIYSFYLFSPPLLSSLLSLIPSFFLFSPPSLSHVWQLSEEGGDGVTAVQWNPNPAHQVVAAAVGNLIVLIATGTGEKKNRKV